MEGYRLVCGYFRQLQCECGERAGPLFQSLLTPEGTEKVSNLHLMFWFVSKNLRNRTRISLKLNFLAVPIFRIDRK